MLKTSLMQYDKAEKFIVELLQTQLQPTLYYHDFNHTFFVLKSVIEIGEAENVSDEDLTILKTAALFHDSGFTTVYHGHEEEGCKIVRKELPAFEYSAEQIEKICSLIMATKTPQNPTSQLEYILCDADLSYLGTDSFYETGQNLFKEWKVRGKINSESDWNKLQIYFLETHHYFTRSAIEKFNPKKTEHLAKLKLNG